jgi:hypothetical protein
MCLLLADNSSSAGGSIGNKAAIALGKRLGLKLATPDLSSGELSKMFGDADLFAMVRMISIWEFWLRIRMVSFLQIRTLEDRHLLSRALSYSILCPTYVCHIERALADDLSKELGFPLQDFLF